MAAGAADGARLWAMIEGGRFGATGLMLTRGSFSACASDGEVGEERDRFFVRVGVVDWPTGASSIEEDEVGNVVVWGEDCGETNGGRWTQALHTAHAGVEVDGTLHLSWTVNRHRQQFTFTAPA